jgi:hypothetical protein
MTQKVLTTPKDYSRKDHLSILAEEDWQQQAEAHQRKLEPWVKPHLKRHELGEAHAVYDFLFSYYSFRVSLLMRWSAGIGFLLEGSSVNAFLESSDYARFYERVGLDPKKFPMRRLESAQWVLSLLEKTSQRPPQYGCAGLHEWAMEYESEIKRYPTIPLRMSAKELKEFVSSQTLACSHYDAFRFFTQCARPLNHLQPTKIAQPDFEQTGCLHVNMDLYKWAYKFYPWIPSHLIADAFLLAIKAREVDMRASPYDLTELGFEPIRIETTEGRLQYQQLQSEISECARPIRQKLIDAYQIMIKWVEDEV